MGFEDFVDVHKDKSPVQKLYLLVRTMNMIASARVGLATAQNPDSEEHYRREIEGQDKRAEWLCNEIEGALKGAKA